MLKVKIKKINPDSIIPAYVHEGDSGFDLYSIEDYILKPGERRGIGTGLVFEIPLGYEMQIRPKSGLALKNGITVLNTPATIDSGYRGEIKVIIINHSNENYQVKKGEKVAQGVIIKVERVLIEEVKVVSETSRGEGGFGSTGK